MSSYNAANDNTKDNKLNLLLRDYQKMQDEIRKEQEGLTLEQSNHHAEVARHREGLQAILTKIDADIKQLNIERQTAQKRSDMEEKRLENQAETKLVMRKNSIRTATSRLDATQKQIESRRQQLKNEELANEKRRLAEQKRAA